MAILIECHPVGNKYAIEVGNTEMFVQRTSANVAKHAINFSIDGLGHIHLRSASRSNEGSRSESEAEPGIVAKSPVLSMSGMTMRGGMETALLRIDRRDRTAGSSTICMFNSEARLGQELAPTHGPLLERFRQPIERARQCNGRRNKPKSRNITFIGPLTLDLADAVSAWNKNHGRCPRASRLARVICFT